MRRIPAAHINPAVRLSERTAAALTFAGSWFTAEPCARGSLYALLVPAEARGRQRICVTCQDDRAGPVLDI